MKTQLKNVFVVLICMIATIGIAASSLDVSVVNAGKKSLAIYMDNVQSTVIYVKLTDKDGIILLNDRVKSTPSFARKYNLENLPGGDYVLSIESGMRTVLQPITVSDGGLMIAHQEMSSVFAPSIQVKNEKLDLTLLCLKESAVTIEIIDEDGHTNYVATTREKGSVERRFNISNLRPGRYKVVTTVAGENFRNVYDEVFTRGIEVAGN
jgi:hypothetical protein